MEGCKEQGTGAGERGERATATTVLFLLPRLKRLLSINPSPGSSRGSPQGGTCLQHLLREASRRQTDPRATSGEPY